MRRTRRKPNAARWPNGKPKPIYQIIPPAVLAHRQALLARPVTAQDIRSQYAGTVLGQMLLGGEITTAQHAGAEALGRLWRRWEAEACAPARVPLHTDGHGHPPTVVDEATLKREYDSWLRNSGEMLAVRNKIVRSAQHGFLALTMIESIVTLEDVRPTRLTRENSGETQWPLGWAVFRAALDELAAHFGFARPPSQSGAVKKCWTTSKILVDSQETP